MDHDADDRSRHHEHRLEPMSLMDQVRVEPRLGVDNWFNIRRERQAAAERIVARPNLRLPRDLMRQGDRIFTLEGFIPDEAPLFPGDPRSIGIPRARKLRRFNGRKVTPTNITQIYNGDDRRIYFDSSYPWACIGLLQRPDGSAGSAALAGRTFILTAAHAVAGLWSDGQPLSSKISFTPAMFDGSSILGSSWTADVVNIAAWEDNDDVAGYDMAICQLDQPMGDWLGYFGTAAYDDDWEDRNVWTHAGYPYDLSASGQRPCYQNGIAVEDDDSDDYDTLEVETLADIASGQSGGPLWGVFSGDRRIIGTLSGREDAWDEPKNSLFAGGNGLNALVRWGRDNWG